MKKTGYRRLLFSYAPIFFFLVTVLLIVFFISIYEMTRKEAERANGVFAEHVMQTLNYSLKSVDQLMIKEILTNETFAKFFAPGHSTDSYLSYEVSEKMKDLMNTVPYVHSAYLYRRDDNMVLSGNIYTKADLYGDREFLTTYAYAADSKTYQWSDPRPFSEFSSDRAVTVVSLVKKVPLLSGSQGLIVVNVSTDTLVGIFEELAQSDLSQLVLTDSRGLPIVKRGAAGGQAAPALVPEEQRGAALVSEVSGWKIYASMKGRGAFGIFSALSYSWLGLGLIGIIVCLFWLVQASRKQYKPVEAIVNRVGRLAQRRTAEWSSKVDEFGYIEQSIDRLVAHAEALEKQASEGSFYRRKVLFQEIMEGQRMLEAREWETEAASIGWSAGQGGYAAVIVEVDKYAQFQEAYSEKDQYLLKFVLVNVLQEMAKKEGMPHWQDWLSSQQLNILFQLHPGMEGRLSEVMEQVRGWVAANLSFTITAAVGGMVSDLNEVVVSRDDAERTLRYKSTLGANRVITPPVWNDKERHGIYEQLQSIHELAMQYRLGDEQWISTFHRIGDALRQGMYERAEMVNLISFLQFQITREMEELSAEYRGLWEQQLSGIGTLLSSFETVEELTSRLYDILADASSQIALLREQRSVNGVIQQAKAYIELHYANPDLSLVQLGDLYRLTPTYLSRMFKEEVGEKLVDYVAKVRMEAAKHLLLTTNDPIQDIALHVGYVHAFSFIRIFKKLVGCTPGDYRKERAK
ncbi:helix-turn-helix domain-containing protein [Paenibacillus oryzisoli]|uniref:AraC family transcriptional regulator n=1 Tax=Paenibacillus oryzisoli TaxID=1850517 RepID=UPI003D288725